MNKPILSARTLTKSYTQGTGELPILKGVSIDIQAGESLCIVGASGSGKSTLLHILGTLDRPDSGELYFEDRNLSALSDDELAQFRNSTMGFVFQFHHVLSEFTAIENIMLPARIAGISKDQARADAMRLLSHMGLESRANHFPNQLSGGELQRVAIGRALMRRPKILFADEPTGNLDSNNSQIIQDLFFQLKKDYGLTLVVVTHDQKFAEKFSRQMKLSDGHFST
ncbi:MAG: lipoprotein-releasing system ATP-binding protein LolD [Oligoflexia bacterium]|nr:MAG: lipoprotein-releasing system ATP-binding protein LolD [Oligoflexia bacterium]